MSRSQALPRAPACGSLRWVAERPDSTIPDTIVAMHQAIARLRATLRREPERADPRSVDAIACSWDSMRRTYEEQAARGVPEAIRGLELIEQDRWPSSGRPRR